MNVSSARIGLRLAFCLGLLGAITPHQANAQLSGLYQSVPGAFASYQYHADGFQTVLLPVDLTVHFSSDNPTSMLTATIIKPIIGAEADGTPIFPIAASFPIRVKGTSQDGRDFHGDLLGSQYLYDWQFEPANDGGLVLNGRVYWSGGRYELTTLNNVRLVPSIAGDYNRDGAVDAADYAVWRENYGTANPLPNDPIGGTVGPAHYNLWRAHFGQTSAARTSLGPSSSAPVPEPATLMLLCLSAIVSPSRRTNLYRAGRTKQPRSGERR